MMPKISYVKGILLRSNARLLSYLCAVFIGAIVGFCIIPLDLILGGKPHFLGEIDLGQHYLGTIFYLAHPWSDGLLSIKDVGFSRSIPVGFFDSVPVFAFLIKIWNSLFPYHFYQSIEPFAFILLILQPLSAVFVIRSCKIKGVSSALFISLLVEFTFLLWNNLPVSLESALCSQWLLLFSIGLYFRAVSHVMPWRASLWFLLLLPVSFFIHPYITAMVAMIGLAIPLSLLLRGERFREALEALAVILGSIALTGIGAYLGGYAGAGGVGFEYGQDPIKLRKLFCHRSLHGGYVDAFWILCLALLGQRLFFRKSAPSLNWKEMWHKHSGLFIIAFGALFFALGGKIQIGHHVLLHWNTDWIPLRNIFRYNDRFAEVTEYLLFFAFFIYWARQGKVGRWVLVIVSIYGIFSGAGAVLEEYHQLRVAVDHYNYDIPKNITDITLIPSEACLAPEDQSERYRTYITRAEQHVIYQVFEQNPHLHIHGALYISRYYKEDLCQGGLEIPHALLEKPLKKGHLVFLAGPNASSAAHEWEAHGVDCSRATDMTEKLYMCHAH